MSVLTSRSGGGHMAGFGPVDETNADQRMLGQANIAGLGHGVE